MPKRAIIGVDIGGSKTLAAVFDDKFEVIERKKFKTAPAKGDRVFERRLSRTMEELLETAAAAGRRVVATGIGCSGNVNFESMELEVSPHVPFLNDFPLVQKVGKWT